MNSATSTLTPADFEFFSALVASGSLSRSAREQGVTTAAISRRLSNLESRLKVSLMNRTTRRMSPTVEGETLLRHARGIMAQLADLQRELGSSTAVPSGLLRVHASLGFGRSHIAPLVSRFAKQFPQVQVRLHLSADHPMLTDDAFDVSIRFGPPPDARLIAKKIADNRRLICAAPQYLAQHGHPRTPAELASHAFIHIRQGDEAYSVLKLFGNKASLNSEAPLHTLKTRGALSTNDGAIAVAWALDGLGIVQRAEWDVRKFLASGQLIELLPGYRTPNADIYAIYPPQHQGAARVTQFVQILQAELKIPNAALS
jgi:LysR family transcriptional regulator, transcriptional activator for dmlA